MIIDCDPGVDDALALFAALGDRESTVEAVCSVFGNVPVTQATRNIRRLLQYLPPQRWPKIGEGSAQPLTGSRLPRRLAHGRDGLGDVAIPLPQHAAQIHEGLPLLESVLEQGNCLFVALGPLTDAARLFARAPRKLRRLDGVFVTAGTLAEKLSGAEFNLASDVAAARCLLSAHLPLRWVPVDVAKRVTLDGRFGENLKRSFPTSPLAQAISLLLRFAVESRGDGVHATLADAVTLALAVEPGFGKWKPSSLSVESRSRAGELRFGQATANASVCEEVDAPRIQQWLFDKWTQLVKAVEQGNHGAHS